MLWQMACSTTLNSLSQLILLVPQQEGFFERKVPRSQWNCLLEVVLS